jgi:hypothetical protein
MNSFCLAALVLTAASGDVSGQPVPTNINPALTYYRAFSVAPDFSPSGRDYLYTNEWRGQKLSERFGELAAGYDNEFRLLRQAAQSTTPCDWGIDWSAGPDTLLPHLARIKAPDGAVSHFVMGFYRQFAPDGALLPRPVAGGAPTTATSWLPRRPRSQEACSGR